ncbi:MAG: hypothetical protein QNJ56_04870 [Gammaproteobacteria bacterium]|nr:hypothetical protein [Gammaproteobacteria bacterium]
MKHLKKTHNQRYVPGLEWRLLKKLPKYLLAGTLIPAFMSLIVRFYPLESLGSDVAKQQMSIDILSIAIVITVWTAVFTIAIGCVVVWIMKGPTYTADSYELQDSNHPRTGDQED